MSDFKDFFSKNAEKYAKSNSHKSGTDLAVLLEKIGLLEGMIAIDIAAGTGFTTIELAKRISNVIAFDGTEAMLVEARKLASEQGLRNIEYVIGDVISLPFLSETFDLATCRRAAHHFKDKRKFLEEAYRTLKKNGKLGLVDMAVPESDNDDIFNAMERLRDNSHVAAEKVTVWKELVEGAGFEIESITSTEDNMPLDKWLYPVTWDSAQGKEVKDYLQQTDELLLGRANISKSENTLNKIRVILIAKKP